MFKTADVYCSEITFFTMMHSPPLPNRKKQTNKQKTKETILYKECKWKLWKVKYENVLFFFKLQLLSAITRPSTDHETKQKTKCSWKSHGVDLEKRSPARKLRRLFL